MGKIKKIFQKDLGIEEKPTRIFISLLIGLALSLILVWLLAFLHENKGMSHQQAVIAFFATCFILGVIAGVENFIICLQDFSFAFSMGIVLGVSASFWYGMWGIFFGIGIITISFTAVLLGTYTSTLD